MTASRLLRILAQRMRSLLRKERADAELDREFAFHLEELTRENLAAGMEPDQAEEAARRVLGNVALLEEQCRDQRRVNWIHDLWQDARHGCRILRQTPGFTAIAALSLALGIGANTAILGVIEHVMLTGLRIPDADRVVILRTHPAADPQRNDNATAPQFEAWRGSSTVFESAGASLPQERDFGAQDGLPAERLAGQAVSHELLPLLGVQPTLGRVFDEDEDEIGHAAHVMILSYGLWQDRFGGDPNIVHKNVLLSGVATEIIGVMPADFRYPLDQTQFWIPLSISRIQLQGTANYFTVAARLRPGVSIPQAQAAMDAIAAQRAIEFPDREAGIGVRVQPLRDAELGWAKQPLFTLQAAVFLVLLIACANVAGLLVARGMARAPELAMRAALGAGRARIARQLLTESVLLSLLGGGLAIAVAWGAMRGLRLLVPPPGGLGIHEVGFSARLLGAMSLISILTGLIFGAAPAVAMAGSNLRANRQRFLSVLVAAQIALALVALTGSGLLLKSFLRLANHDLGFRPDGLLAFEYRMPVERYLHLSGSYQNFPTATIDPPPAATIQRLYRRLRQIPGAASVAGISYPVLDSLVLPDLTLTLEGKTGETANPPTASYFLATPNLFATLGVPMIRGRDFNDDDRESSPWAAIINETAARRFWPGEDPIGKRLRLDIVPEERPREVIGVVRDIWIRRRQKEARPVIYTSFLQQPRRYRGPWFNVFGQMTFLVRAAQGDAMRLLPAARQAAAEVDPLVPLSKIERMEGAAGGTRGFRDYALVVTLFGIVALGLAAIGIYGVMAYAVARRRREIGIRIALGADAFQVAEFVGKQALAPVASGMILGLAGSVAITRWIGSQLWGVDPLDPQTFAGVVALLGLVALAACSIPGKRAIQVDPSVALRSE